MTMSRTIRIALYLMMALVTGALADESCPKPARDCIENHNCSRASGSGIVFHDFDKQARNSGGLLGSWMVHSNNFGFQIFIYDKNSTTADIVLSRNDDKVTNRRRVFKFAAKGYATKCYWLSGNLDGQGQSCVAKLPAPGASYTVDDTVSMYELEALKKGECH